MSETNRLNDYAHSRLSRLCQKQMHPKPNSRSQSMKQNYDNFTNLYHKHNYINSQSILCTIPTFNQETRLHNNFSNSHIIIHIFYNSMNEWNIIKPMVYCMISVVRISKGFCHVGRLMNYFVCIYENRHFIGVSTGIHLINCLICISFCMCVNLHLLKTWFWPPNI